MSMRIAVVGVEGSGKTVLLTTWATRQNNSLNAELLFVPKNSQVLKYVNRNWGKLQNGQWPDSTPQSEWQSLEWTLRTSDGNIALLNTLDMAGHDIRRVFSNSLDELNENDLDDATQKVRNTILDANVIFLVINLKNTASLDFDKRTDDEAVLLNIFQYAKKTGKKIVFTFTQWSDCQAWVNSNGGTQRVLQDLLPNLYSAISLFGILICIFCEVSAVVETETITSSGGHYYQVPRSGFSSQGFDRLNTMLSNFINGKARAEVRAEALAKVEAEVEAEAKKKRIKLFKFFGTWIGALVGMVICLVIDEEFPHPPEITVGFVVIGGLINGVIFRFFFGHIGLAIVEASTKSIIELFKFFGTCIAVFLGIVSTFYIGCFVCSIIDGMLIEELKLEIVLTIGIGIIGVGGLISGAIFRIIFRAIFGHIGLVIIKLVFWVRGIFDDQKNKKTNG